MVVFHKPVQAQLAAFENIYNNFLALIERMPFITRRQVNSVLGSPFGESPFYRVLEVYYDDYAKMQESLTSDAGQAAGGELQKLAANTFEMLFAEVYEETGGSTPMN